MRRTAVLERCAMRAFATLLGAVFAVFSINAVPVTILTDGRALSVSASAAAYVLYDYNRPASSETNQQSFAISPSVAFAPWSTEITATATAGDSIASSYSYGDARQTSALSTNQMTASGRVNGSTSPFNNKPVSIGTASTHAESIFRTSFWVTGPCDYSLDVVLETISSNTDAWFELSGPGGKLRFQAPPNNDTGRWHLDGALVPGLYTLEADAVYDAFAAVYEGYFGRSASYDLNLRFVPGVPPTNALAPNIIIQPRSRTNVAGSSLILSVTAVGTEPLLYQWFKDAAPIADATGRTLVLTNVQSTNAGTYYAMVGNSAGVAQSSNALLSIQPSEMPNVIAGPLVNPANGHGYYLLEQSTWVEAEAAAQILGGHLVTLRNAAEQEWAFTNFSTWGGQERNLWIGLHDADPVNNATNYIDRRSEFVWVSGEPLSYTNWSAGEPNNYRELGEFYVHTLSPSDPVAAGAWNDTWDTDYNQRPIHGVVEVQRITLLTDARSLEINGWGSYCPNPTNSCQGSNYHYTMSPSLAFGSLNAGLTGALQLGSNGFPGGLSHATNEATQFSVVNQDYFAATSHVDGLAEISYEGQGVLSPAASESAVSVFDITFYVPQTVSYRLDATLEASHYGSDPPFGEGCHFMLSRLEGPDIVRFTLAPPRVFPVTEQGFIGISGILSPGAYRLTADSLVLGSAGHYEQSKTDSAAFSLSAGFSSIETSTSQVPSRIWTDVFFSSLTIQPPTARTNAVGSSAVLSAGAESTQPLTFRWFKDGVAILGATNDTYLLTNIQPADAGIYHVTVSNVFGLLSSDTVLTVVPATDAPPPILTGEVASI
jgi:hypothetical protein